MISHTHIPLRHVTCLANEISLQDITPPPASYHVLKEGFSRSEEYGDNSYSSLKRGRITSNNIWSVLTRFSVHNHIKVKTRSDRQCWWQHFPTSYQHLRSLDQRRFTAPDRVLQGHLGLLLRFGKKRKFTATAGYRGLWKLNKFDIMGKCLRRRCRAGDDVVRVKSGGSFALPNTMNRRFNVSCTF